MNNMAMLVQQMQQAEFYPHPVNTPVELVQTHISYVFLTGDYAYKVKKAVNFGFLDFTTLAQRQHFLEEELRLNQAVAPDMYLEVLPINRNGDTFSLDGDGEIIEYALKMNQFPQENLFINMFEQGKLTKNNIEELGKIVSDFHRDKAITNEYISSFGMPKKVWESISDNYQQTSKYIGLAQTQEQFEATKAYTDKVYKEQYQVFIDRIKKEKIRECHGDLHLKNICEWQGRIQLFDRIEFNEPFRFVDVMYDVAFAVMDLHSKGAYELANIFLNTYLERTGDWEGLAVLPLYLSRQAYVRAKVNSFLLDDPQIPAPQKEEVKKVASSYYKLAYDYTQNTTGKLLVMSGLSGSGKTTLARTLAGKLNAIHLRSDAVRKHIAGIGLEEKGGNEIYTAQMSEKTYHRLWELGVTLVKLGYKVILDAKYDRLAYRTPLLKTAQTEKISLEFIYCSAPVEVIQQRLQARKNDISDATGELTALQQAQAEAFTKEEEPYLTVVDTTQENYLEQLLKITEKR